MWSSVREKPNDAAQDKPGSRTCSAQPLQSNLYSTPNSLMYAQAAAMQVQAGEAKQVQAGEAMQVQAGEAIQVAAQVATRYSSMTVTMRSLPVRTRSSVTCGTTVNLKLPALAYWQMHTERRVCSFVSTTYPSVSLIVRTFAT